MRNIPTAQVLNLLLEYHRDVCKDMHELDQVEFLKAQHKAEAAREIMGKFMATLPPEVQGKHEGALSTRLDALAELASFDMNTFGDGDDDE